MSRHHKAPPSRGRTDIWFGLGMLAAVLVLIWMAVTVQQLSRDLRAANDARDALASQVQQLGERPVAGPPGSRDEPSVGPQGPRGPAGERGPSGSPGRDGKEGDDGKGGEDGADGTGEPGPSGAAGTDGADGAPGETGVQGEPGPAGPAGPAGEPGPRGEPGPAGPAGPACPDGYTLQAPADDPDALVCRRDGAPPADPAPGPGGGALDPQRRQYP